MAVLEKIRRKTSLLILVIGLALFSFVISDFITKGSGANSQESLAVINGEEISIADFNEKVDEYSRQLSGMSGMYVVNAIWNQELKKMITSDVLDKVGMKLYRNSFEEVAKKPNYKQYFQGVTDESGNVDFAKYNELIYQFKTSNPDRFSKVMSLEKEILDKEAFKAYEAFVKAGVNMTTEEAKLNHKWSSEKADVSIIKIPYTSVSDTLITVSDAEIKAYLNSHKNDYKQKPAVDLEYAFFKEEASAEDEDIIKNELKLLLSEKSEYNNRTETTEIVKGFGEVEKIADFVDSNSDKPYVNKYMFESQLPASASKEIVALSKDEVYGPYKDGVSFKLTRKLETVRFSDSVSSSHIVVPFKGSKAANDKTVKTKLEAKSYIDSIYKLVKNNKTKFKEIADSINVDGTKGRGGNIGWTVYTSISPDTFDKNFSDYLFFGSKQRVAATKVVETKFGYHIIRIDEVKSDKKAYKLATIERRIEPSEKTINDLYTSATSFEVDVIQNKIPFEEAIKKTGVSILTASNVDPLRETLSQVKSPRNIIKWAFLEEVKQGDIKRFNTSEGYAVVRVVAKKKEGVKSLKDAKPEILPILKKQKKAEVIIKEHNGKSFDELSNDATFVSYQKTGINIKTPSIPGIGREPKVVGEALAIEQGEVSDFIRGEEGVYKLKVNGKQEPTEFDGNIPNTTPKSPYETLKVAVEIEDNRALFY